MLILVQLTLNLIYIFGLQIQHEVNSCYQNHFFVIRIRYLAAEISESEVRSFTRDKGLQLLRVSNTNEGKRHDDSIDGWTSISQSAPVLFSLCDLLWKRDALLAEQGIDV